MSRISRLTPVTLTSYAAYLLLAACSDGGEGTDGTVDPGGTTAGSPTATGGSLNNGGSSSGVPNSPAAGKPATGGASSAGAGAGGVTATAGAAGASTNGGAAGSTTGGAAAGGGAGGVSGGSGGSGGSAGSSNPACDDGDIQCGGSCVDPQTSEQHCGACGKMCVSGQQCESGQCECADDRALCNNQCVDTDADEQNCGSCGKVCGSGQQCESGTCACSGDLELCSNACVNTDTDEQNCGGCGTKCSSGQTCENGSCSGGSTGGSTCSSISNFGTVSETIVVKNGQTYDGQCRRYRADADSLGDGSQKEGQKPVFIVEGGGKLINVVLGAPAADGIHTKGNVTLENITWEDIGEDALTIKESGTVILNGGSATNGEDKVFQVNAASTFRISNFKASNAGKFIRQNGGSDFKAQIFIDKCDISDMDESIFRTDSSSSTVSMTNTRYHNIGGSLFMGVSSGNITQSGNTEY
jgi:hypothetical protein